jgi:hypothetical protein
MTREHLHRIQRVTDNFFFWQGLRWVPMGVALLACAAVFSPRFGVPVPLHTWIALPILGVALWLSTAVFGRYYAGHFGRVHGDPSRHVVRTYVKWLVVCPAIAGAILVDSRFEPPLILSSVAFAIAIEAYRQSTGGGRIHYIVASVYLAAFSILPVAGLASAGRSSLTTLIGILGVIYIVGGILDHRELVRMLAPPIQEEPRGSSV